MPDLPRLGITRSGLPSVRKLKEGDVTAELFGFLTCEPNDAVRLVHPKAMPVILTSPAEWRCWLTSATNEALKLQRPLARRFGAELLRRLDPALGTEAEPVAAEADASHFGARIPLPEPIGLTADLMGASAGCLSGFATSWRRREWGGGVRLALQREDRSAAMVDVVLARAMRDPVRISALILKGVDEVHSRFRIDGPGLTASTTEPLAPEQIGNAHRRLCPQDRRLVRQHLGACRLRSRCPGAGCA